MLMQYRDSPVTASPVPTMAISEVAPTYGGLCPRLIKVTVSRKQAMQ
jgi:hypothetical protein